MFACAGQQGWREVAVMDGAHCGGGVDGSSSAGCCRSHRSAFEGTSPWCGRQFMVRLWRHPCSRVAVRSSRLPSDSAGTYLDTCSPFVIG